MEFRDYYATLGVDKKASEADIKRAFRKLAREHHPDLNPGNAAAEARFKEVNEAYEVLGDPEKRRKYDELGANWKMYEQAPPSGGAGPFAGGQDWSAHFGGGGPGGASYRTMSPEEMEELFGGQDPFSDFFHTFFGGAAAGSGRTRTGGGRARRRAARGQDQTHPIDLSFDEAFHGTTRRLMTSANGVERTVDVRIPAGVRDGARVRVAGEGGPGAGGGEKGDLFLAVRVLPHASFERRENDLYVKLPVPVTTAVLGGEVSVPTPGGSTLRLKVPSGTPQGRVFRMRGHGMPIVGKSERGDLYATVELRLPAEITDEERSHYEALRALEEGRKTS